MCIQNEYTYPYIVFRLPRDTLKIEYLINAYTTPDEHFLTTSTYPPPPPPVTKRLSLSAADEEGAAAWPAGTPAVPPTATHEDIQTVLDVLPHLQPVFVAKLLQRYENSELAIAAVLEGNLPPDLNETTVVHTPESAVVAATPPRPAPRPTASKLASLGLSDSVIVKRNKGFPGAPKTLSTLLDDKSHVRQMRTRYQEYDLVADNDYDDEYDDSYDALAESETKSMRNPNRVIANELQDDDAYADEESSSDEEAVGGGGAAGQPAAGSSGPTSAYFAKSKDFCENPELARERRAQNWNNKMGARAPRKPAKTR